MKKLGYLALALTLVAGAACSDNDPADMDTPPTPSANGVFPSMGFTGRDLRVEVTGDATNWTSSATVSFGDGITVNDVMVASPTDLFADITVDPGATLGTRDVTVTDGGGMLTLSKAFQLVSPVDVTTAGLVAQGSVATFTIRSLDFEHPFDTTCAAFDFFGDCLQYSNLSVTTPSGVIAIVSTASDYVVQGTMFIDVDAPAAGGPLSVVSGPAGGTQVTSTIGTPLAITARTATTLTAGMKTDGTIANPGDSGLYQFSAAANSAASFAVSTGAQASMYLIPSSGHFLDTLSTGAMDSQGNPLSQLDAIAPTAGTFYIVYVDDGSASPYSITPTSYDLTATAEAEGANGNDTSATAQAVTAPALVTTGVLETVNDQDWFKITVPLTDAGKHVHVTTQGDPFTDTLVNVFAGPAAGTSLGASPDATYQEDFQSDAIPTGTTTIYVEISASQAGYFDPAHNTYDAAIWIEP